jgi:uncharacterized SAM-binding protein YcdF (DUF218 family)
VFWLKKFISFWLMPVPLCLALLVAGLALERRARHRRKGRVLSYMAAALLVLLSNKAVSNRLLRPLESEYPAIPEIGAGARVPGPLEGCAYVVVLGGGSSSVPGLPATDRLSTSGLSRIVEAVRLLRVLPGARLMVSGPGEPGRPSHATILATAAQSLGIDPSRITLIDTARDTEDEAQAVARIAVRRKVALVTSAWHMPRAARLFRAAGVDFVACPADFVAREDPSPGWGKFLWDSESLERSTCAFHEWLGLLWLRLKNLG